MLKKILPNNEHNIERLIRLIIGAAALSLVFVGPKTMWGLIGIIPIMTGLIGSCPIYTLLGVSTCKISKEKDQTKS
ncbi:MAG: DUF2892 domain-containing protein [Deltaproteobacteria bacterium]|nr:DUF2892 domain-containing protein [Deltaproteobacteria bacterium]